MELLPIAAAAAGAVFALLSQDERTSIPLQVAAGASYCLFHGVYIRLKMTALDLGAFATAFSIGIAIQAVPLVLILTQSSVLQEAWLKATGLSGLWSVLPVHLVIFIVEAYIAALVQKYSKQQDLPLPFYNQDIYASTNTAREDTIEARQRRAPNDSATIAH
jgi:hypothetical protein